MQNEAANRTQAKSAIAASPSPTVKVIPATREFVDFLLSRNNGNRRLSEARVAAIARDIASGNWRNNGSTIVVDADWNLRDGQHRLHAIRAAGCPDGISIIVVKLATRGADADRDFLTMNTGRTGAASQMFAGTATHNPREVTAICRMICAVTQGQGKVGRRRAPVVTNAEIAGCHAAFRETVEFWAGRHSNAALNFPSCALAALAMLEIARPERRANIRAVARDVGNGENLAKGSPTHRLFTFLMSRRSLHMSSVLQHEIFATTLNAMDIATADGCSRERAAVRTIIPKNVDAEAGIVRTVAAVLKIRRAA